MNKSNAHLYLPLVQALTEGKTIQVRNGFDEWKDMPEPSFTIEPYRYQIKPASFPPKPDSCEWHNPDGLTPEQIGDGWRLTVEGEKPSNPDMSQLWQKDNRCFIERDKFCLGDPYQYFNTYRVASHIPFPDGSYVNGGELVKPWVPKFKVGDRVQSIHSGLIGIIAHFDFDHKTVATKAHNYYSEGDLELAPWSLTRHITGFRPLRDGEEWFDNGWREELLPEGYRPLLKGELPLPGDEYDLVSHPTGWDTQTGEGFIVVEGHRGLFHRTRRPLPEPPKLVPLGPSDWLKDGPWWIRSNEDDKCPSLVVSVNVHKIFHGRYGESGHEDAMRLQRTNDGINWLPCSKTA